VKPHARLRVFCLPYAGGGTHAYAEWATAVGSDVELCPVLLPGREERLDEPAISTMDEMVPALATGLAPLLDLPFVLFGHSMGGMIAFALARHLAEQASAPTHLFLSACSPLRRPEHTHKHRLPDLEFVEELRVMNGTPPEFFEHEELLELILPKMRADFTLSETYGVEEDVRLAIPITAFAGDKDDLAPPTQVENWREHTTARFSLHVMPGDHFFLNDFRPILDVITPTLRGRRG
jgi:medium-chain acyl-[acyl-carrier-protein] hydrolase